MPEYKFKCKKCKKITKSFFPFDMVIDKKIGDIKPMEQCGKCKGNLSWNDVLVEFAGAINMNSSSVGVAQRKYSNKAGGPKPVIDNKIRNDLKMPTQV